MKERVRPWAFPLCTALLLAACGSPKDTGSPAEPAASSGGIDWHGGTVDRLRFAVFGDVRPPELDEDDAYPVDVVNQLFSQISARDPQFVLGVGDWWFASNYDHAATQAQELLSAEQPYGGFVFHAMGNHECEGWTASNCPDGDETGQVQAWYDYLWTFSDVPYLRFDVETGSGKARFLILAPNAWNTAQEAWLQNALADDTDYTFILRHEPPDATSAPGVEESGAIIENHAGNTLLVYGHYHYYQHLSTNEVISGNGGAPLYTPSDGSTPYYGYLFVEQRDDGDIQVSEYEETTDALMDQFVLTPTGEAAD